MFPCPNDDGVLVSAASKQPCGDRRWALAVPSGLPMFVLGVTLGPESRSSAGCRQGRPRLGAKASYTAFAGKKGAPKPGVYDLKVAVERDGSALFERSETYSIE